MMGAERRSMVMRKKSGRPLTTSPATPSSRSWCPEPTRFSRSPSSPGPRWASPWSLPSRTATAYDSTYLDLAIAVLFGGRIAEELFMNQMTTGASNDFERATAMAGHGDPLRHVRCPGSMVYGENDGEVFSAAR